MSSVTGQAGGAKLSDVIKFEEDKLRSHLDEVVRDSAEDSALRGPGARLVSVRLPQNAARIDGDVSVCQLFHSRVQLP